MPRQPSKPTMMSARCLAAAFLLLYPAVSGAQRVSESASTARADSQIVIQKSEMLLAAISARDTAAARPLLVPGALFVSVADPAPAAAPASLMTDAEFYRTLPLGKERFLERMWNPTVIMHGSLAEVHAPYDFHIDGKFSHCGTDVFTFVRQRGTWMIAAISYTRQRVGCAPSPLGPISSSDLRRPR